MRALLVSLLLAVGLVAPAHADIEPLPTGTDVDYQLGGPAYVPDNVGIVVRDRTETPAPGAYNVCYVNGFQTQPGEKAFWKNRMDLVLHDDGEPVEDSAWGEWLLDIRTAAKRKALARIVGRWVDGCAEDGYAAVEYDNLDSFSRSHGLISKADAKAYARRIAGRAHGADLAVAQKNWSEWDGSDVFDFTLTEDCARWRECGAYVDSYGDLVFDVEYGRKAFHRACRDWDARIAVVRRDLALSPDGLRRWC